MVYKFSQNIQIHQIFINIIFLKAFLQTILPNYPSLNWLASILAAQLSSPITLHLHLGDSSRLFLMLDPISYTPCLPDSFWSSISSSKVYFLVCFPQPNGPLWVTTSWVSRQTKISVLLCAWYVDFQGLLPSYLSPGNWQVLSPLLPCFTGSSQWWRGLDLEPNNSRFKSWLWHLLHLLTLHKLYNMFKPPCSNW